MIKMTTPAAFGHIVVITIAGGLCLQGFGGLIAGIVLFVAWTVYTTGS